MIDRLRSGFGGTVLTPADAGYDPARVLFNAMIDKRPQVIAQCASPADVQAAIRFAREHKLEIAVRGGGHSVAGTSLAEGGLVIDLRLMHAVSVDPVARLADVGGGATMSHLDRATGAHGLATTGGRVSTTGAGGFTLGGGGGWLDRKFGLACDNLVSAEIVLANGDIVRASADEHPDLFWGLHGGGGNFGVVTSMRLKLYPLNTVWGGLLMWPAEAAPRVLRAYRDFIEADAPDEVGGGCAFATGPEADFVPAHLVGRHIILTIVFYAGSEADGRKAFAPMLGLGHEGELLVEVPYAEFNCMFDDPPGHRNYWSAEYLRAFPDEAIDAFCGSAAQMLVPSPSQHALFLGGGKAGRETADWPLPWRSAPWCSHPFGVWADAKDDQRGRDWVKLSNATMQPWATGAAYLNFMGDEGEDRTIAGLGRQNYARLARIKAQYDPDNVFHLNHNIRPTGLAAE
ncbi:MAG: FAD-binding oxidoreductase [Hyphomicrobiales bacterium]|nr:MAG: FAD-binding oxidoreductase [Hyphomicrobiales bacterium]